jgi:pimeloyl-ACP methyl ester carboxylesterase
MISKVQEEIVEVGEFRVNYARAGSGDYVFMLHGSDSRENWRIWERLLPLTEKYTLILLDLIGYGKSSKPIETPDYKVQARVILELMDRMNVDGAVFIGSSWGGQVALEVAIEEPSKVKSIVLIASTYDKNQLLKLSHIQLPTLILWAEDDLITQLKAAYLLRDTIRTSRLEVLEPTAKNPEFDFTVAHKLERYKINVIIEKMLDFLSNPEKKIVEPPEMEPELRGIALKSEDG